MNTKKEDIKEEPEELEEEPHLLEATTLELSKEGKFAFMVDGLDYAFQADDFVTTKDKITGEPFIDFIGVDGRLYQIRNSDIRVRIMNFPDQDELAHFVSLKRESLEMYDEMVAAGKKKDHYVGRDVI